MAVIETRIGWKPGGRPEFQLFDEDNHPLETVEGRILSDSEIEISVVPQRSFAVDAVGYWMGGLHVFTRLKHPVNIVPGDTLALTIRAVDPEGNGVAGDVGRTAVLRSEVL